MDAHDNRFLNAILLGAVIGIPVVWVVMTLGFMAITDQRFVNVAGFSALPAFFCGPFLGGLFTTALAQPPEDEHDAPPAPAADAEELQAA